MWIFLKDIWGDWRLYFFFWERLGEGVYSYILGLCIFVVIFKSKSSSKIGKEDVYILDFVLGI